MNENPNHLPTEFQMLSTIIDSQSPPIREAFQYCLCLMMVETGNMRLVEMIPGDEKQLCLFETIANEQFTIPKPPLSPEQEESILFTLREILKEEGLT